MEHGLKNARNLKLILLTFEQLSDLNINFRRREIFCFGEAQNDANLYATIRGVIQTKGNLVKRN
jgi:hypothetical protein